MNDDNKAIGILALLTTSPILLIIFVNHWLVYLFVSLWFYLMIFILLNLIHKSTESAKESDESLKAFLRDKDEAKKESGKKRKAY